MRVDTAARLRHDERDDADDDTDVTRRYRPGRTAINAVSDLWNPMSGRFDPARLRRAMVLRGWTVDDLARAAGIGRTTAYKTVAGHGVRDKISIKVLAALGRQQPRLSDMD